MSTFFMDENAGADFFKIDNEYRVVFNGGKYKAKLKIIGTQDQCDKYEHDITQYLENKSLKAKINKGPNPKQIN